MLPQRINLIAYSTLAVIICYIDRVNISVAIIPMQEQFGWSDSQVGFIFSSFYVRHIHSLSESEMQLQSNLTNCVPRKVVPRGGIEPPTRGFSVLCSTN